MAGFDIVLEFSNATVVKLFETGLNIGSGSATPPFDLDLGVAHLIVTDLQIDLLQNDTVRLTVYFNDSSVTSPVLISPLDGWFTTDIGIVGDGNGRPILNLPGVQDIQVSLSQESQMLVTNAVGSIDLFESVAKSAIQVFISMQPAFDLLPKAISIVPGQNGSYSSSGVVLESVEAHCLFDQDRSKQSLAFFGIILAANAGNGDFTQRMYSAIVPGDDVCISIAPGAFNTEVACPALAKALTGNDTDTDQLPPQCGASNGLSNVNTFGVTVTSINETFADGHIDLNALGNSSPQPGMHVNASVHATITVAASNGNIDATVVSVDHSFDVSLDWWVWFVSAILGPLNIAAAGIADAFGNNLAQNIANSFGNAFKDTKAEFGLPVFVDQILITAEGLTVNGRLQADSIPIPPQRRRQIQLSGSVVTESFTEGGSGTLHLTTGCPTGDYPYTIQLQQQQGTYEILPTLMGYPMKLEWSIGAGNFSAPLDKAQGQVTLEVQADDPLAPPITKNVTIAYMIDAQSALTIHLRNVAQDGNYWVWLTVTATDPLNNVAQASALIEFEGAHLKIGGTYVADLMACLSTLEKRLKEVARTAPVPFWNIPNWVPVDHPTPDTLANFIRTVAAIGGPVATHVLTQLKLAHGANFDRAIQSVQRAPLAPRV